MNILFVAHSIPRYENSGTPIASWRVAKKLKEIYKNINIGFIIPSPNGNKKTEYVEGIKIYKTERVDFHQNFFHDFYFPQKNYMENLERIFLDFKPDVLHIYNFVFGSYQLLTIKNKFKSVKIIRTFTHLEDICFAVDPLIPLNQHLIVCSGPVPTIKCAKHYEILYGDNDINFLVKRIASHFIYIENLHKKYVDTYIFTTNQFAEYILSIIELPREKVKIIPHGLHKKEILDISVKQEKNEQKNLLKLCFIGGTNPRKGISILLEMIEKYPTIISNIIIYIIGPLIENNLLNHLEKLSKINGEKIEVIGQITNDEVISYMKKSDVVILPTLFETYNIALREALTVGVPVITTSVFGSDIIKNGINGFKLNMPPTSDQIYNILKILVDDHKLLCNLKENAKNTPIMSIEEECKELFNLYFQQSKKY